MTLDSAALSVLKRPVPAARRVLWGLRTLAAARVLDYPILWSITHNFLG